MKYINFLKFEIKGLSKDKMMLFMLLYPIVILVLLVVLMPLSMKGMTPAESASAYPIVFIMIICMGPLIGGMLLGFSILENKDEKTLNTIAVTPLSLKGYIIFKSLYCSLISIVGNLILLYGLKLFANSYYITFNPQTNSFDEIFSLLNFWHILTYSISSSMLTSTVGLLLASLAKNKVEGLVLIKTGGLVVLLPALSLLAAFGGYTQYVLGILPNFWCVKALQNIIFFDTSDANLPFYIYQLIGLVYSLLLCFLSYRLFIKKLQVTT